MTTTNPQSIPTVREEFGATETSAVTEVSTTAAAAQAQALVQARFIMALRNPRDLMQVRQRMLADAKRPGFARVAIYSVPRGGKEITGASIRFAEAALRAYGNCDIATTIIDDTAVRRIVHVSVTDIETNYAAAQDIVVEKTMERKFQLKGQQEIARRLNSYGDLVYLYPAPESEVLVKQNALVSKAIRTLALRLIPGDIVEEALWQVEETMLQEDAQDPAGTAKRICDSFQAIGITAAQLKSFLGHSADTVTPQEAAALRSAFTALKDGETSWEDVMELRTSQKAEAKAKAPEAQDDRAKLIRALAKAKIENPEAFGKAADAAGMSADVIIEKLDDGMLGELAKAMKGAK